jgi:outer membrane protein, multidrug efflux system
MIVAQTANLTTLPDNIHENIMKNLVLPLLCSTLLSACSGFYAYEAPELQTEASKQTLATEATDRFVTAEPIVEWWSNFSDPELATLVEAGLRHNLDVQTAIANVKQARAQADRSFFDYFPAVSADAGFARRRINTTTFGGAAGSGTEAIIFNAYNADLNARWEANLFGRVSEGIEAQRALEEASLAQLEGAYIMVAADIARTYMQLRGAQQRLAIAERNAANQARTYELTEALFEGGMATKLDSSRAQSQLQLTRATIPPIKTAIDISLRRLSVLTGELPEHLREKYSDVKALPSLPPTVNIGNAEQLLKRRPDVYAAEQQLVASIAQYNVANTELFPVVSVIGSVGYLASNLSDFGATALVGTISPSLSWRLLDFGRVEAEIDAADARAQAALATYKQSILLALEDTQNALTAFTREEQRRAELEVATKAAKQAAEIARVRFEYGADAFISVLDAERTQLQAEDALAESNIATAINLINIYQNLGGGWKAVNLEAATGDDKDVEVLEKYRDVTEEITGKPRTKPASDAPQPL